MPPLTRLKALATDDDSDVSYDVRFSDDAHFSDDNPLEYEHVDAIQSCLHKAEGHVTRLRKDLERLRKENDKLCKEKIELAEQLRMQEESVPRSPPKQESGRIQLLKAEVKQLKVENKRHRRKIEKLQAKAVKEEAEDLECDAEVNVTDDLVYRLRKLLRRHCDLMLSVTLAEGETCPVCLESLKLTKCSSMPCEHLICNDCLPQISRGADETVHCPMCRRSCERDQVMLVHMSETSRWDEFFLIAQAYAAIDVRGNEETEDEENEEEFIDDGHGSDFESTSEREVADDQSSNGSSGLTNASTAETPPPTSIRSYSESPTKDKRKRLERLVEDRLSNKKCKH